MNLTWMLYCNITYYNYYFSSCIISKIKGQVIRINSGFYDILSNNKEYRVRASGNLRNTNQSPLVGDFVLFEEKGFIFDILERKNYLTRPKVANLDQIIIVSSIKEPYFNTLSIDKYLIIVEYKKIHPVLVFTKNDLEKSDIASQYKSQGYEVYSTSLNNYESILELSKIFKNKLSVFTGYSGVGKTTLINFLTKNDFQTQNISKFLKRGKHTTRITQIIPFNNGLLVDTPGFSIFEHGLDKFQLARAYKDFDFYANNCEFRNCLHYKELKCEIKKQVELKNILEFRYTNYIKILKEVLENETN